VRYYKVSHGIQVSWNVIVPCYHSFNSSGSRYIQLLGIFPRNNKVSIVCNEIRNNKNYGEPYWERIDGNGKSCNLTIIEGKYGLKRDPPCLTILDVQKLKPLPSRKQ
jgi:hypothetical protein